METIVDGTRFSKQFILLKRISQRTSFRAKSHVVDDSRRPAAGCRRTTAVKVVTGSILRRLLQIHVGVRIDTAGADIHPIRIDDFFTAMMKASADRPDFSIAKGDIRLKVFFTKANRSTFDDIIHDVSFFLTSVTDNHNL